MKKHFIQVCYWLALMLPLTLHGQSNVLDQYIAQALANNLSLNTYQLEEARQNSKISQAAKLWQPRIDLGASYLLAEGGRTIVFPVGDLFNPVYGTLNRLTASQSFPEDLDNFETQLTPNNYLDASLTISKPIINSAIKYNIKIQEALVKLSSVDRRSQENEITFQVKQAYYNFLKTVQGILVLKENESLIKEILAFNQKLIKHDKVTPDILSDVEYQLARIEGELISLAEQQQISRVLLNTLLNRDLQSDIEIDDDLNFGQIDNMVDLRTRIDNAMRTRPEFEKLKISAEVQELQINRINSQKLPTLSARGAIGIQAQEFSFNDGGPLYTIGLSLGWNLFDGGMRKNEIEELKIAKEQNDLEREIAGQQITLQVAQAYYNLKSTLARLDVENAAIKAANISYISIKKKYENEKALLIELLNAQNKLTTSKLKKVLLSIDILILEADLDRVTYGK